MKQATKRFRAEVEYVVDETETNLTQEREVWKDQVKSIVDPFAGFKLKKLSVKEIK